MAEASFSPEAAGGGRERRAESAVSPELQVSGCGWAAWTPAAFQASGGPGRARWWPWAQQGRRKGTALGQLTFHIGTEQVSAPQTRPVFILSAPAQSGPPGSQSGRTAIYSNSHRILGGRRTLGSVSGTLHALFWSRLLVIREVGPALFCLVFARFSDWEARAPCHSGSRRQRAAERRREPRGQHTPLFSSLAPRGTAVERRPESEGVGKGDGPREGRPESRAVFVPQ